MKLIWSASARTDIRKIDIWLEREASPEMAVRTLAMIKERARFLTDFPRGGRPVAEGGFRLLRVHAAPYLIVYNVVGERVEGARVFHEREDWQLDF